MEVAEVSTGAPGTVAISESVQESSVETTADGRKISKMSESEYAMAKMADAKISEADGVRKEERVQAQQEQKQSASVEVVEGPGVSCVRQQQVQQNTQQTQQQSSSVQNTSTSSRSVKSSTVSSSVKSSSVVSSSSSSVKSSATSIKASSLQAKSLMDDMDF